MLLNRDSLKGLFQKGKFPSENHFAHLIDSSVNKIEDGIGKTPERGLQLAPQGKFDQVVSVYERMDIPLPAWQIKLLRQHDAKGLSFEKLERNEDNEPVSESRFFLANDGKIGIHTTQPWAPFHANTTLGMNARIGTHKYGQVKGDGKWQTVLDNLSGVQAFEIVARIDGPSKRGKYAITHAVALRTFGGRQSRKRIPQTRAYYGWFWNRVELKWDGDDINNYQLKVRTRHNYGSNDDGDISMIKFHVTKLWDDTIFSAENLPQRTPYTNQMPAK